MADAALSAPDIFLSYAREDETRARELATALEQRGFSVFWDREVPPGQTWHSYIGQALVGAKCVVVAWSRYSITSDWVIEEASEGKRRRVLLPVLFETVQPPFGFGGIQAASLVDWQAGRSSPAFNGVLSAIERIVGGRAGSATGAKSGFSAPLQSASSEPKAKTKSRVRSSAQPSAIPQRRGPTLYWALVFLVIAIIAALFGFGGIASASAGIAQILFFIFLMLLVITLVMYFVRVPRL